MIRGSYIAHIDLLDISKKGRKLTWSFASALKNVDTKGIAMLGEDRKLMERKGL